MNIEQYGCSSYTFQTFNCKRRLLWLKEIQLSLGFALSSVRED